MAKDNKTAEFIAPEDLIWLRESVTTIQDLRKQADVLHAFTVNTLTKKYRLGEGDNLNSDTGEIVRRQVIPISAKENAQENQATNS